MRIYLAGPINGCTDDEAKNWRDELVRMVPHVDFVDPMVRDYRGREDECVLGIVENDKADIDSCNMLIANCWQVSAGTSMEILYAAERGMPVLIIIPSGVPISPWYRYHATSIAHSLEEAAAMVPAP